jgi:hypothetical protein
VGEEEDDPAARPGRAAFGGRSQKWFGDNRRGHSVQKLYPARPAAARSTKNLLRKETMSQSEQEIGFVVKEEGVGDAGDRGGGGATLSAVAPLSGLLLAVASASTGQV